MKELYVDLISKKKSKVKIYLGTLSLAFAFISAYIQYAYNNLTLLNIIYSLYFFLFGTGYIYEGLGKSPGNLLGGKFIDLKEELLTFKLSLFGGKQSFPITRIKAINIGTITIEISTFDGETYKIEQSFFFFFFVVELKQFMSDISGKL